MPLKINMQRHSVKRRHLIRNERRSNRWGMSMFDTGKKGRQRAGKDRKKNKENGHTEQTLVLRKPLIGSCFRPNAVTFQKLN